MHKEENSNKELENQLSSCIEPVMMFPMFFHQQRMMLHEMFTAAVANAPDDEIDNFTAKKLTPFYLSLIQMFENFERNDFVMHTNASAVVTNSMTRGRS
ncbi:MAG: hypothetical protein J0M25_00700 [Flavobacteriales bacterium]|nr:hypothetical protein [Flavobacteriales bacterium]